MRSEIVVLRDGEGRDKKLKGADVLNVDEEGAHGT